MRADVEKMRNEQLKLAEVIVLRDSIDKPKLIAGCDCTFDGDNIIAVINVVKYPSMEFVEAKYSIQESKFPYIPGYLTYRILPAIVDAFSKLTNRPDIMICDGNGIIHQRRIGSVSHIGLVLDTPTIGVAKKLAMGHVKDGKVWMENEIRGFEMKTKDTANPIYISPGHKVSLGMALRLVKNCIRPPHKMPEPLHAARKYANKIRKNNAKTVLAHV